MCEKSLYVSINDELTRSELIDYCKYELNKYDKRIVESFETVLLTFYRRDEISNKIAVARFVGGKFKEVLMIENKSVGPVGKRISKLLKDSPVSYAMQGIDEYFQVLNVSDGNLSETLSSFRNGQPLNIIIANLSDGVKGINYADKKIHQTNKNDIGADIDRQTLLRSLDSDKLPFHEIIIDRDIIINALYSISPLNLGILTAWYDLGLKLHKDVIVIKSKIEQYKKATDKRFYMRAYRNKRIALNDLINCIIDIQTNQ